MLKHSGRVFKTRPAFRADTLARKDLAHIDAMTDKDTDYSDILEFGAAFLRHQLPAQPSSGKKTGH